MSRKAMTVLAFGLWWVNPIMAQESIPAQDMVIKAIPLKGVSKVRIRHRMDMDGMVMNENKDRLPFGCKEISEDVQFTVHAGRKYARKFNGKMFAYDQQEWNVKPCSRITIKFVNDDHIRHQFMIHGLLPYLYPPTGMFNIEVSGPGSKTASLIVSDQPKTHLVHCELAQHTEYGMKAQLKVAGGYGDLSSVPGITAAKTPDYYEVDWTANRLTILVGAGLLGVLVIFALQKWK